MPSPSDAKRIATAHTPLGDKLVFREMYGRESISSMFEYNVEFLAEDDSGIDPHDVLGRDITIEVKTQGGAPRYISGQCTRFAYVGREPGAGRYSSLWRYAARLRPWIWYMTRESDCRIFQRETVPQIIRHIFAKYSFPIDVRLSSAYREWVYCVQYQETDFNFVSRLMEQEGIYYWFEHSMGQHMLVLADDISAHPTVPGYGVIPCIPSDIVVRPDEEWIDDWGMAKEVRSGQYVTNDFDWEHPSANLVAVQSKPQPFPNSERQIYDFPGGYAKVRDGEDYSRVRMEELQQPKEITTARSSARGLAAGYLFTLEKCPRADQNREYLLLEVECEIRDNPYHGSDEEPAKWSFRLKAQPTSYPYRPPRTTPKPRSTGPQTAVVVGPPDEEIWTNEHGEVKVQFWWDLTQQNIPNSEYDRTCWIRVSSGWAGSNWGMISIPRIGQEVIVDFLYGDLDYPIIIGRVYNAEHKPPYVLPRWKEYSTWKSRSTKKGGNNDWNELRFYDYKGKEQVFIHANWRMDVRVKWNKYLTVKESYHIHVGKGHYLSVGGDNNVYTYGNLYESTKGEVHIIAGGDVKCSVDSNIQVSADGKIEACAYDKIVLQSYSEVTLKVGGNFIKVDMTGVTIQGTMVLINSGGSADSASDFDADYAGGAEEADDGTPGYLDRPKPPGGGWKRKSKKGGPQIWGGGGGGIGSAIAGAIAGAYGGGGGGGGPPVKPPAPPLPPPKVYPPSPAPKYATSQEAAVAAMQELNPNSVAENREYGGWIKKNPDGTFSPEPAVRGSESGLDNMPAKGADDVEWYHTHGAVVPDGKGGDKFDSENFSGDEGDHGFSKATGAVGYVATPSGAIKKYDPAKAGPGPRDGETVLPDRAPP